MEWRSAGVQVVLVLALAALLHDVVFDDATWLAAVAFALLQTVVDLARQWWTFVLHPDLPSIEHPTISRADELEVRRAVAKGHAITERRLAPLAIALTDPPRTGGANQLLAFGLVAAGIGAVVAWQALDGDLLVAGLWLAVLIGWLTFPQREAAKDLKAERTRSSAIALFTAGAA